MIDTIGFVLIGTGLGFSILGCVGMVRMPDVFSRLQVSTKCVTLGTVLLMLGVFLVMGPTGAGVRTLVCLAFILLASPAAAHALARAVHRSKEEGTK